MRVHTPSTTIAAAAGGNIIAAVICSCISLAEVLHTEHVSSNGVSSSTSDGAEIRWISTPRAAGSLRWTVLLWRRPVSPIAVFHTTSIRPSVLTCRTAQHHTQSGTTLRSTERRSFGLGTEVRATPGSAVNAAR